MISSKYLSTNKFTQNVFEESVNDFECKKRSDDVIDVVVVTVLVAVAREGIKIQRKRKGLATSGAVEYLLGNSQTLRLSTQTV